MVNFDLTTAGIVVGTITYSGFWYLLGQRVVGRRSVNAQETDISDN